MKQRIRDSGPLPARGVSRRKMLQSSAAALAAIGFAPMLAGVSHAQSFPSGPVTIVVPFPPGGQADTLTRVIAIEMAANLGQPVIVDNRGGAGGAIGTASVVKARPDGYTLAYSSSGTVVVLPLTNAKLGYDPEKDLTPIGQMFEIPLLLVARKGFGPSNVQELVAAAKAAPGKFSIGNTGVGGLAHLVAEYVRTTMGVDFLHVPYRGDGPLQIALVGGELDLGVVAIQTAAPFVTSGEMKPIALLGAERLPSMQGVPTLAEAGYPGFAAGTFGGLHAPAGTPQPVITRLSEAMSAAVAKPAVRERILKNSCVPVGSSPAAYGKRLDAERKLWGGIISRLGIKLE
ncbi:MAG: tripartite tricarboxylate transporter substrate binding protein [Betaproteobacteria bacterium]|nr:tripartite tricarboxylate transporter substrate binding protein [Betaproteobacteria bacterium]MBA3777097.1 tripartite tricarboxylate transporter substrate binding protein [Betaproteobacteria bacterium]